MVKRQWGQYLYKEHGLIAVDVFRGASLQLLDVFAQVGTHHRFSPGKQGPFISKLGSIAALRNQDPAHRSAKWQDLEGILFPSHAAPALPPPVPPNVQALVAVEGAAAAQEMAVVSDGAVPVVWQSIPQPVPVPPREEPRVLWERGENAATMKSTNCQIIGITLGLLEALKCQVNKSHGLAVEVQGLYYVRMLDQAMNELFLDRNPAWLPDNRLVDLNKPAIRDSKGNVELWVVTEIHYCTTLLITGQEEGFVSSDARIGTEGVSLLGPLVPGAPVQANLKGRIRADGDLAVTGDRIAIGFKAQPLKYNRNGELVRKPEIKGFPILRGSEASSAATDADPNNMTDFFLDENMECKIWSPELAT